MCGSLSIIWHCLSLELEGKLTFSSPVATAEFSKFAGILSAALSQHHLSGFGISHTCAYIPSLLSLLTSPHHPTPLRCHRAPGWPPLLDSSFPRAICFTHGHVYMSVALSQLVPPSLFPDMSQVCSPHLCLYSCPIFPKFSLSPKLLSLPVTVQLLSRV